MKNIFIKKLIIILMIFLLVISASISFSKAFVEIDVDSFEEEPLGEDVTSTMNGISGTVIAILRSVSVAIAIVMLLVIAMRYMLSAPGDRADLKKHAVAYVVGAFLLFGLTGVLTILFEVSKKISAPE